MTEIPSLNHPLKRSLGFFLGIALFFPIGAFAGDRCDFLAPWTEAEHAKPIHATTIKETSDWKRAVALGINTATEGLYESYRNETITDGTLEECLRSQGLEGTREATDFKNTVPATFFRRSLQDLRKIKGAMTEKFSSTLLEKSRTGQLVLFRLVGHFANTASPTGVKAGFHRGEHSIFMDFSEIPANDWLLIFAHEYAHSLDTVLSDAMPVFANPELRKKIEAMASRTNSPRDLSTAELQDLDRWLIAGLDRSFLAEVRAWALSYEIYSEGLVDGAWKPIAWMEDMLRMKQSEETTLQFALRYLSPRFTDPTAQEDGMKLLTRPLVATRLKQIRRSLESGEIPVRAIL